MAIKQVTAVQAMEEISKGKIITASLNEMQGAWIALADCEDGRVLTCAYSGECQAAALFAKKDSGKVKNITVDVMELNPNNASGAGRQRHQHSVQRLAGLCGRLRRSAL